MSEQEQAPVEGTPDPAAPAEEAAGNETEQQAVDYEKRYNDMRSEFDRRGTRVSELESQMQAVTDLQSPDPDTRSRAAQALGLEFAEDPAVEDSYADPTDALTQRLAQLEQSIQERDQQAQQQAQVVQVEQHVEQQLNALDGLDDEDKRWIVNSAIAMPPKQTADGLMVPDIEAAHQAFVAWEQSRQKKWRESKRAPHISQVGTAGTQALPAEADHNARVAWALEQLQNNQ